MKFSRHKQVGLSSPLELLVKTRTELVPGSVKFRTEIFPAPKSATNSRLSVTKFKVPPVFTPCFTPSYHYKALKISNWEFSILFFSNPSENMKLDRIKVSLKTEETFINTGGKYLKKKKVYVFQKPKILFINFTAWNFLHSRM